jgi:Holliday junction DNA helicase RuvB
LATEALTLYEIDHLGLDEMDRKYLGTIIHKFQGGPVGIETLSSALGEERETLEDVYEPYLIQEGLLARTPRGRMATLRTYEHLGITPPPSSQSAQLEL